MTRKPRIPMLPSQLPQQRLYLVKGLPERPANWSMKTGKLAEATSGTHKVASNRSWRFIAT